MNAKTAKLIGRYVIWSMGDKRIAKRAWKRLPWTRRHELRQRMQMLLSKDKVMKEFDTNQPAEHCPPDNY